MELTHGLFATSEAAYRHELISRSLRDHAAARHVRRRRRAKTSRIAAAGRRLRAA